MNCTALRELASFPHTAPETLPLYFTYGGKPVRGIPSQWNPSVQVTETDAHITETVFTGTSPDGMEVRMVVRTYRDFAAEEYTAYFTNKGKENSPILEDIRIGGMIRDTGAVLYHGNGDTCTEAGYEWWETPVEKTGMTLAPCGDGTSCNGAFPYMRLRFAAWGVNVAIGWSGTWEASFTETEEGIRLLCGQKRCHMTVHPGETMRTPMVLLLAYDGGDDSGRNTWRRFHAAHVMPRTLGKAPKPMCCVHLIGEEGLPEFTGATEKTQIAAMETYIRNGLRPDVWWIDAGWYPCDFDWFKVGNWYANPQRFPNGLKPVGEKCKELNLKLLLWFEPERAYKDSQMDKEHPEWLLHWHRDGVEQDYRAVNLGSPECCDYMIEHVDALIKEYGVGIYRQDFNYSIGFFWEEAETEDRIGAMENLHIQGYYRYWDTLLQRNPGLLIDSCAGGGRRNDIETMRRAVTLHYTDIGYGNHPIKLKQHRQMHEWIPYFRAHNQNWCAPDGTYGDARYKPDRFSYYVAMTPALTDGIRFDADKETYQLAIDMQKIWRRAAGFLIGTDYYPLTECRKCSDDFYAAQFHDTEENAGILHLLNGSTAKENTFRVCLKGLQPDAVYTLESAEAKKTWHCTGAELMNGIQVVLDKRCGDVWFYKAVH